MPREIKQPYNPSAVEEIGVAGAAGQKLAVAAMAVGLEDHRAILQEKMRQVRDHYDLTVGMLKAGAGVPTSPAPTEDHDVPGDITIMGDTHNYTDAYHAAPKAEPPLVPRPVAEQSNPWKTGALILGSVLGGSALGAGGVAAVDALTDDPPAAVAPVRPATPHVHPAPDSFGVELETK